MNNFDPQFLKGGQGRDVEVDNLENRARYVETV